MDEILRIIKTSKEPLSASAISRRLGVPKNQAKMVRTVLGKMVKSGKLVERDGAYYAVSDSGLIKGTVCSTLSGADFFVSEKLKEDKKIVKSRDLCLMHGDVVLAKTRGGNCTVIKILERANEKLVGTVYAEGVSLYLVPDEKKIREVFLISRKGGAKVNRGDKVIGKIIAYPTATASGVVKIEENLGSTDNDETAILSVLYKHKVDTEFPQEVLEAANEINQEVQEAELGGRLDLRSLTVLTIDGDDAKDLDDAVSLGLTERGDYLLGVHISDVSHYVTMDSKIDLEARKRGTSVYIPGKVYPMLPKTLSNGICSLNENQDRLTISCFMIITRQGKITEYSIQPSVIRSKRRMTYSCVSEMLENVKSPLRKEYKDVFGMLLLMKQLAEVLIKNAHSRGSIDFDMPEAKIVLDENDFPVDVAPEENSISHQIIEQFMLAANQTVAEYLTDNKLPGIYRVHEKPEEKKLQSFNDFISSLGYVIPFEPTPKDFQALLEQASGKPEEELIKKNMLRSMSKAKYKATCDGHFGLAYEKYLHFTSPIRRYPDLIVHRVLNMTFINNYKGLREIGAQAEHLALTSTEREIAAAYCERDVTDIRKAQYMSKHVGEHFSGTVSFVTAYGMFVMLDNLVEGYVPVNSMDGYFEFDELRNTLDNGRIKYSLGDRVDVTVFSVNIPEGKVELTVFS